MTAISTKPERFSIRRAISIWLKRREIRANERHIEVVKLEIENSLKSLEYLHDRNSTLSGELQEF